MKALWAAAALNLGLRWRDWLAWNGPSFRGEGYSYQSHRYATNLAEWLSTTFFNPVCLVRFLLLWGVFALALAGLRAIKKEAPPEGGASLMER